MESKIEDPICACAYLFYLLKFSKIFLNVYLPVKKDVFWEVIVTSNFVQIENSRH